jgi:hypothetical protein
MPFVFPRARALSALAAIAALSACAGGAGSLPPSPGAPLGRPAGVHVKPRGNPPACKGQTTTTQFASLSEKFKRKGAALCIPAFGGFGGSFPYPAAKPMVSAMVTSSTTNYNRTLPVLAKGKPLFFLQAATSAPATFGSKLPARGGLEGHKLSAGKPYTVYGQAKLAGVAGITITFTPCSAVAVLSKYGGLIGGMGKLLAGQNLAGTATITFEVFAGAHTSNKC